jgi:transcriptional regulator with PAS, ATPase and Fis domain
LTGFSASDQRASSVAEPTYIPVNCGAIPESLIESELFGAERRAYTGAATTRRGLFEAAAGGTVFLDEISALPLALQPALLRMLQNREARRLGGTRTIGLYFRLIAASNQDLGEMVTRGRFRADLFHRLRVVSRTIAPLRGRPEDIAGLAEHFVKKFAARTRPGCRGIGKFALRALTVYRWPGNVRELENSIERAVVLGSNPLIEMEDFPETITENSALEGHSGRFHEGVTAAKRKLVQDALARAGSFVEAAGILEIHPNYLHRLVNHLGIAASRARATLVTSCTR